MCGILGQNEVLICTGLLCNDNEHCSRRIYISIRFVLNFIKVKQLFINPESVFIFLWWFCQEVKSSLLTCRNVDLYSYLLVNISNLLFIIHHSPYFVILGGNNWHTENSLPKERGRTSMCFLFCHLFGHLPWKWWCQVSWHQRHHLKTAGGPKDCTTNA